MIYKKPEKNPKTVADIILLIIVAFLFAFIIIHSLGCTTWNKKRAMKYDNPNCEIGDDLELKCPAPDLNNHP